MDSDAPVKEVLDDLYTLLEALETQNIAILQFLKEQKIAPEDKLQPYLEQAGNASSVKWRAARARMNHLFAPAPKKATEAVRAPGKAAPPSSGAGQPDSAEKAANQQNGTENTDQETRDGHDQDQGSRAPEKHREGQAKPDQRTADSLPAAQSSQREPHEQNRPTPDKEQDRDPGSEHSESEAPRPGATK